MQSRFVALGLFSAALIHPALAQQIDLAAAPGGEPPPIMAMQDGPGRDHGPMPWHGPMRSGPGGFGPEGFGPPSELRRLAPVAAAFGATRQPSTS